MKIKTKDLWQSAFLLTKGSQLDGVELNGNGRKKKEVVFTFRGPDLIELQREFQSGQALCNVARLRASMIHLKELIFEQIANH